MKAIGVLLGIILIVVLAIAWLLFGAWIISININDIVDKGANMWNVFWILVAVSVTIGGTAKATS